jgi:F-type H+-transporting ATPase subunit epsilon
MILEPSDTDATDINSINLKILMPTEILFDGEVTKVVAEAQNGLFCLLPRHIDFVSALVPGILYFYRSSSNSDSYNKENFVAIDTGVLVKCGEQILVSVLNAVRAEDIERLKSMVSQRFLNLSEHEMLARAALTRLEAGTIRRFIELEANEHA